MTGRSHCQGRQLCALLTLASHLSTPVQRAHRGRRLRRCVDKCRRAGQPSVRPERLLLVSEGGAHGRSGTGGTHSWEALLGPLCPDPHPNHPIHVCSTVTLCPQPSGTCILQTYPTTLVHFYNLTSGTTYQATATALVGGTNTSASNAITFTMPASAAPTLLSAEDRSSTTGYSQAQPPSGVTYDKVCGGRCHGRSDAGPHGVRFWMQSRRTALRLAAHN